jgi:predicted ABC-type ATPase
MDLIVEKMAESKSLVESWGEVIDVTEFMTDSSGFFNTNGLGAFTQIYDRADGRYRPVYTNESDLKLIRAMSWLLVEKVPMAQAWVNRLLDYTIGTGFDWTIKADDKRLEKAIQLYVRESLDVSNWSTELERESYMREVADGEFIGEHIYEDGQCMVVSREADELTEPAIKGELEEWLGLDFVPSWTFGVLTKESLPERPIGYHFVRNSAGTDWDYVPADRVCMWKRNVRSRGKRGFSDFYKPHLYLLRADRVLTNTAEGAATQAAIAYIVEHRDGTQRQADNIVKRFAPPTGKVDPLTGLAQRRRRMLPGTRLDVPEGQAYKAGLLGSNNSGIYIEVMESALRLAGSVHAFVEGMLTGSYANNNFASALVAEGPFMQGRLAEQSQRKERMRDMILKIIKLGASKGRFRSAGFDSWDAVRDRVTVEVIPSRIIPVDPLKTAQALAIQKQNGWVSDKTCINELGRDIDTETANGLKVGGAEKQAGADGQPGAAGPAAGQDGNPVNVSKNPEPESSLWLGLSRQQWQRNRKAVSDVLTDFADGKTRRSVAVALLRAIGMPEQGIQTILRDASDGQIDSLPPEQMESVQEAERKTLNRPFRTSNGPKKFAVYVKNEKGNVIRLGFGDPKMKIKRDNPGSRRGFRARHNCQDPGPKYKARYWSCRFWSKPSVSKLLRESVEEFIPWDGKTFVRESWLLKTNPRLQEAFCATGKKGGVKNDCPPKRTPKAPAKPKFVSSDRERNLENDKVINGMLAMFNDADMAGLQSVEHPSPKVMEYSKALQRALHASGVKGGNPIDLFGSSSAMHQRGGVWTDERRELHAEIYDKLLTGAEPVSNPVFVLLGGGSASGKSTLTAGGLAEIPGSIVRVDSDQIKAMLPEYAEASGKDARAAAFVHDESAYMAKELAAIASGRGYNTMLDGTGNGSEGGLAGKVGIARDRGMKVVAVYATTDLDTALKRNAERAKTDGRMVPNSFLRYSHSQVSALFPRFVANGSFDEAHLYDTTGDAKKIATYQNGSLEVHDPKAYRKFLDKAGR